MLIPKQYSYVKNKEMNYRNFQVFINIKLSWQTFSVRYMFEPYEKRLTTLITDLDDLIKDKN